MQFEQIIERLADERNKDKHGLLPLTSQNLSDVAILSGFLWVLLALVAKDLQDGRDF